MTEDIIVFKNELKPCCVCGGEMRIDYQTDQDYERGYYAVCNTVAFILD